jgi:hypothetical protein
MPHTERSDKEALVFKLKYSRAHSCFPCSASVGGDDMGRTATVTHVHAHDVSVLVQMLERKNTTNPIYRDAGTGTFSTKWRYHNSSSALKMSDDADCAFVCLTHWFLSFCVGMCGDM